MFKDVESSVDFPALEQRIIDLWRRDDVFRRSVAREAPKGDWVFFEGPPTANAQPGIHHVLSRAYKDLFPRFKTMQGYRVGRKGGWDTHGLPVEIALEQRLGFTNKQQIEEFGIAKFNELCREDVWRNIQDWNAMTERIGFWIDLDDPYITYTNEYIESCWWVMKSLFDRGLLVEDYKTTWHSPSSNTTLASHEVALGYQEDVEDPSIYPKFRANSGELKERKLISSEEERPVYFLAWTTTPWTLPANVALAVHPEAPYVMVEGPAQAGGSSATEQLYIVARELAEALFGEGVSILAEASGAELAGLTYEPLMRGRQEPNADLSGAWRVIGDDFVALDDGTGIVHIAPAYGDLDVGRKHGLPALFSVDLTGGVMPEVRLAQEASEGDGPYTGVWFKEADERITRDLMEAGLMFRAGVMRHAYPFNWRDDTPLMNVAKKSWYIRTTAVKELLLANNDAIGWHPDHIRTGRFGRWLENNVDWALSRERFWGAPLPIWENEDGSQKVCVGSVKQLEELTGRDLSELDLHRPYIDEVTFEMGGETFRRVPYTVDVWFESGAMPYAQWHYLGDESTQEARENLKRNFPADYICEAIDQTRGWFYSLHALGTLLTDPGDEQTGRPPGALAHLFEPTSAFKNLNVLGHLVDGNGEKMSKSRGNTLDPWSVLDVQGADALRWYLYSVSPAGATKRISGALVEETLRDYFMTLHNVYGFFVLYANLEKPDLSSAPPVHERPLVDRWLASRLATLTRDVTAALEEFDPTAASRQLRDFVVDELSNWYVRINRRRFWRSSQNGGLASDSLAAYATLHGALVRVAELMAPMAPFYAEELYQNLVLSLNANAPGSVHLAEWPAPELAHVDEALEGEMRALIRLVELGRSARAASSVKLRQPLPAVIVRVRDASEEKGVRALAGHLMEELNVKEVRFLAPHDDFVDYVLKPNLPRLGRRLGPLIPQLRAALEQLDGREVAAKVAANESVTVQLASGESLTLEPADLLLEPKSPEGYAAEEDRGYLAALDTRLTDELLREGLARDAVRLIQNARKNAGLDVSDRIEVVVNATGRLRTALKEHAGTLAREVLAVSLEFEGALADAHQESGELGGEEFHYSLRRAAP